MDFVDRLARHDVACAPTWAMTDDFTKQMARVRAQFWLDMLWSEFGLSPRLLRAACWVGQMSRRMGLIHGPKL